MLIGVVVTPLSRNARAEQDLSFRLRRSQQYLTSAKVNSQQVHQEDFQPFLIMLSGPEAYAKLKGAVLAVGCFRHPSGAGCSHHRILSHLTKCLDVTPLRESDYITQVHWKMYWTKRELPTHAHLSTHI